MAGLSIRQRGMVWLAALALAACQPGSGPFQRDAGSDSTESDAAPAARSVRLVDRDVEAPEVFQVTDAALWDGRPSLGGVWVASPDAVDPERVIMRNTENGKFVIGALFRRERDNPGPALQISSDAAEALGLLAGQPGTVSVTALRREEEAPTEVAEPARPILDAAETVEDAPPAETPAETAAETPAAGTPAAEVAKADASDASAAATASIAAAAIAEAEGAAAAAGTRPALKMGADALEGQLVGTAEPASAPTAAAAPKPASGGSLIQIGIFSVEANAKKAVDVLAKGGVSADVRREQTQGKTFWSVTTRGDSGTLQKVKAAGFADAYALKR